ncbi:hypothetical protein LZ32DRAFT_164730 [Colletotrichum eremochloae]|nr:hypothetical protein LZ32DRAFT_164730 [Colletotrichum eremochloae]
MNWTEGALARHSRGRGWKPELAKQRQYFAKARAGLRVVSGPNIASISVLPRLPESPTLHRGKQPPRTLIQSSPHFQPQQSPHGNNGECRVDHSPHKRPQEEEPSMEGRSFPELDRLMHTSAKRKHTVDDEVALDVKRRRLLQKTDWAGINVPKSVPFHFSARNNLAGNQIWGFRKKHDTRKPAPFFQQIRHKNALRGPATTYSSTRDGGREVRIVIGNEDIRLGSEASNTEKNIHKRSLRTLSRSNNYYRSGYFQHSSSRTFSQHNASPENHDHREVTGHITKSLREIRSGRDGAAPRNAATPVWSSASHGRRTKLEHVQRAGQHLVVESSPSVVHHPVPQRLSQLVSARKLGTPKSDAFGSTIAEVGYNPLAAVASSEMSENERWHGMFASSGDRAEIPDNIDYNRITAAEDVSPGVSNFPVPSCPPTQRLSPEGPQINSPSNLQEPPTDNNIVQVGLRRYHHGPSDDDDGRNSLEDTVSVIRFSSPREPTNISLSSDKLALSDLNGNISYIQGMTRMTEDVENMIDTIIQSPSLSMTSDSSVKQTLGHNERDECNSGKTERLENPSLVLQSQEIDTGRGTSVPEPTPIGADVEWIKFIFGDGDDEVQEIAFQEARKEAARDLRPSSGSANSCCQTPESPSVNHDTATAATYATSSRSSEKDIISPSHSTSSSGFKLDHISMRAFKDCTGTPLETYNHVDTHTDMAESIIVEVAEPITQGARSGYHMTNMPSTPALDSASTVAQPPESEVGEVSGQSFQFARPKTFIGRLATSQDAGPILPLSIHNEPSKSGRSKRRSRKKKAKDGRADIRRVPDHDGDPIDGGSDE